MGLKNIPRSMGLKQKSFQKYHFKNLVFAKSSKRRISAFASTSTSISAFAKATADKKVIVDKKATAG